MWPDAEPGLLDEIVVATAAAGSADEVLARAAQMLLRRADWVFADRLEDPDVIVRVAGFDRTGEVDVTTYSQPARRSSASTLGLLPRVLEAPHQMLRLNRRQLEDLARDPTSFEGRQAARILGVGTTELIIVALFRRGQALGVLSLGRQHDYFTDVELAELATIASYLSVVLDASRLYATQAAVATAVQTHLLAPVPVIAGLRLAARYEPAARGIDVGGDWYDAFPTASGLTVVIGDTAGHDLPAAASMADLRNLLRAHAVDRDESPAGILARLEHTAFALQLDVLATCIVGCLQPIEDDRWRFTWSNAGHLPPVMVHDGQAVILETPPDLLLGVDRDTPRSDHVIDLAPGDHLLLYTDGLIEVPGEPIDDRIELLRGTVEHCTNCSPGELCDALVGEFMQQAVDDVAMFALDVVARSSTA